MEELQYNHQEKIPSMIQIYISCVSNLLLFLIAIDQGRLIAENRLHCTHMSIKEDDTHDERKLFGSGTPHIVWSVKWKVEVDNLGFL